MFAPSKCELRTWLRANTEVEEAPPSSFQVFLANQGIRHEIRVLEELKADHPDWVDVDGYNNPAATSDTAGEIRSGKPLIYQGKLEAVNSELGRGPVRIIGYPDFLVKAGEGYVIADAKLARSVLRTTNDGTAVPKPDKRHIALQLQLYGWLFKNQFPDLDFELVVCNGAGEREKISFEDQGQAALSELERLLAIQSLPSEPAEAVGWSKCGVCGFFDYCWSRAEGAGALGLVPDLNQNLARKLWAEGISSYQQLLGEMDAAALAEIKSPSLGSSNPSNLAGAERILENACALATGEPIRRESQGHPVPLDPRLADDSIFVMFDLEGVPPELEDSEKVYLWGMQVFGSEPGPFLSAFAGFGPEGDREGWNEFLRIARGLLDAYPGIRFVHWASYEKTKINSYIERYPDSDIGTAKEVLEGLLDLLPITKATVALPLPSYSLKVIEQMSQLVEATGFSRLADDVAKGDDSIAAYMEAVETGDGPRREELMGQLAAYNQEDLEATWAVQSWLRDFTVSTEGSA